MFMKKFEYWQAHLFEHWHVGRRDHFEDEIFGTYGSEEAARKAAEDLNKVLER